MYRSPSLGKTAARGVLYLTSASGARFGLAIVTQIFLGWLLAEVDFGVYAVAISLAALIRVMRDGGVRTVLVQAGAERFDRLKDAAMWLSFVSAGIVAAVLVAVSGPASDVYGEPQVRDILLVVAGSVLLGAYPSVALARLQIDMRFGLMASLQIFSQVVTATLTVAFAFAGLGPMSFVLPLLVRNVITTTAAYLVTRIGIGRPQVPIRSVFRESKWAMAGAVSASAFRQIDYVVLGLVATTGLVGFYFFAYRITMQMVSLLSEGVRKVILPVLSSVKTQQQRMAQAVRSGVGVVALLGTPVVLIPLATARPLEALVWHGRWETSVVAMQLLSITMPFLLLLLLGELVVQAVGHFRMWAGIMVVKGLGLASAAYIGGAISSTDDPSWAAFVISTYLVGASLVEIGFLRRLEMLSTDVARSFGYPFVLFAAAAVAVALVDRLALEALASIVRLGFTSIVYLLAVLGIHSFLLRHRQPEVRRLLQMLRDPRPSTAQLEPEDL